MSHGWSASRGCPKLAHRAHVWGVYVTPRWRGKGVATGLLTRLEEVGRGWPGVNSLALAVSENSPGAHRVYEAMGFRAWGREPGAAIVDGCAYDEIHMVRFLDPAAGAGRGSTGAG